jgi:peroxiredoxin
MSISAQVSDPVRRVHEALQAFVASGEYNVSQGRVVNSDAVTGGKATAYDFSQVFGVEGTNDTSILFPHMKELEQTLRSEAVHAKEVMIHDAKEGAPLVSGVLWLFGNPNGVVSGKYVFGNKQNIRLLSFNDSDGQRYAVLLVWEQQIKTDQQIGDIWMMNGTIFEIAAKKREDMPFILPYSEQKEMTATIKYDTDPTAPQTYDELLAKVKQTCQIYDRETSGGKTAAVVVLHKMCDAYPNKLTREQYNTLIGILSPYAETAVGQKHKEMFGYTCYTLFKKSEQYQAEGGEVKQRPAMITSSTISTTQLQKVVSYNGLITNGSEDLQLVDCQISGTAPADADSVTVRRTVSSFEELGKFPVRNGRFSFTCRLPKDEVCGLTTGNRYYTFFWADGQPINADLVKSTVKSQKTSQQRNNFLNETEAERLRMLKIKDRAELDAAIAKQRERYRQVIFQGKDDLLRTYAIYKMYSELSYDELKPFVSEQFRYSNHLLMAPVKEYVAGLEKRRPGKHYEDMLVADTLGNAHQLQEYIGKGYVVLHFWESWNRDQFDILPQLRTLYDQYHAKGLQILSLVIDSNYKKQWADRLKEENLPWPQLSTKAAKNLYGILSWPETVVIGPDGTIVASPSTVQELEAELKKIFSKN